MLARTGLFSRDSIYESNLRDLLKDPRVNDFYSKMKRSELTPLLRIQDEILVKDETHTPSGTFKYRGASLLLSVLKDQLSSGLVATSTGNHGLSLAVLCDAQGLKLTVCVPNKTSAEKIARIKSFGADVLCMGYDLTETIALGKEMAFSKGKFFVSSTDELLALGHSTLISEAYRQNNSIQRLYFPIGVGSGIAGQIIGKLIHDLPIQIIGVVHEAHPAWSISLQTGRATLSESKSSLAPGLRVSLPSQDIFHFVQKHVNDVVVIGDSDLKLAANCIGYKRDDLTSLSSLAAQLKVGNQGLSVFC